jgi:hypothetical protein
MRSLLQANRREAAPRRRMRWQWILETAASLGIDQAEFEHGVPGGYEALLREAGAEQGIDGKWRGRSCAGAWMFVSGLAHPSFSRSFGSSINESEEIDGEFVVWSRTNPKFVFRLLKVTINLHIAAVKLFKASCAAQPDNDSAAQPATNTAARPATDRAAQPANDTAAQPDDDSSHLPVWGLRTDE